MTPEELWDAFIAHLNEVEPLGKRGEFVPHASFIGSIAAYKKRFLEATAKAKPLVREDSESE